MSRFKTPARPLFDEDAERRLLACISYDHDMQPKIAEMLSVDDFYIPHHQLLFDVILALGDSCDICTLEAVLVASGRIGELPGGEAYLHADRTHVGLAPALPPGSLRRVAVVETANNTFEYFG